MYISATSLVLLGLVVFAIGLATGACVFYWRGHRNGYVEVLRSLRAESEEDELDHTYVGENDYVKVIDQEETS